MINLTSINQYAKTSIKNKIDYVYRDNLWR